MAIFPVLDSRTAAEGLLPVRFRLYLGASIITTPYGFGRAALIVLGSTFPPAATDEERAKAAKL